MTDAEACLNAVSEALERRVVALSDGLDERARAVIAELRDRAGALVDQMAGTVAGLAALPPSDGRGAGEGGVNHAGRFVPPATPGRRNVTGKTAGPGRRRSRAIAPPAPRPPRRFRYVGRYGRSVCVCPANTTTLPRCTRSSTWWCCISPVT